MPACLATLRTDRLLMLNLAPMAWYSSPDLARATISASLTVSFALRENSSGGILARSTAPRSQDAPPSRMNFLCWWSDQVTLMLFCFLLTRSPVGNRCEPTLQTCVHHRKGRI